MAGAPDELKIGTRRASTAARGVMATARRPRGARPSAAQTSSGTDTQSARDTVPGRRARAPIGGLARDGRRVAREASRQRRPAKDPVVSRDVDPRVVDAMSSDSFEGRWRRDPSVRRRRRRRRRLRRTSSRVRARGPRGVDAEPRGVLAVYAARVTSSAAAEASAAEASVEGVAAGRFAPRSPIPRHRPTRRRRLNRDGDLRPRPSSSPGDAENASARETCRIPRPRILPRPSPSCVSAGPSRVASRRSSSRRRRGAHRRGRREPAASPRRARASACPRLISSTRWGRSRRSWTSCSARGNSSRRNRPPRDSRRRRRRDARTSTTNASRTDPD